jgi:hypothetical protein
VVERLRFLSLTLKAKYAGNSLASVTEGNKVALLD